MGRKIEVALALDSDPDMIEIYRRNFQDAKARMGAVERIFDGVIGSDLSETERLLLAETEPLDILVGGPPCQGHSDLNNHTRRNDPKNALYMKMARAAEVLRPRVVILENVAAVQLDKGNVVSATMKALAGAGYKAYGQVIDLQKFGIPQRRRRFVVIASSVDGIEPSTVFAKLEARFHRHCSRTVRWAIGDLCTSAASTLHDTPSSTTSENARRIAFLFDNDLYDLPNDRRPVCHRDGGHSYVSVYGRLRWNQPAQTITTGFGCMGQGRYVHPQKRRTITPHEAARLQTFPDWFNFAAETRRGVLAKAIGNAVPPLLMIELAKIILPSLLTLRWGK
jgi:DNA (cytosine-5)-methyltransferase 1